MFFSGSLTYLFLHFHHSVNMKIIILTRVEGDVPRFNGVSMVKIMLINDTNTAMGKNKNY